MHIQILLAPLVLVSCWWLAALYRQAPAGSRSGYLWDRILVGAYIRKWDGEETDRYWTVPNAITLIGIIAVASYPVSEWWQLLSPTEQLHLIIISGASDILDGFFARSLGQCTRIGKIIDPVRDRMLGLAILTGIMLQDMESWYIAAGIITMEVVIAWNFLAYRTPVHALGKVRMAIHIGCGILFVTQRAEIVPILASSRTIMLWMLAASLAASFAYCYQAWRNSAQQSTRCKTLQ
jgi:phosphatidylglycerophosphate synthase